MVAKVITGKNIRGILHYNENKVAEGAANCILAHLFGADAADLSFSNKMLRFEKLSARNPKVKTNAVHISLNFDASEQLPDNVLTRIASTYMDGIGFGDQPYLVYRHHDAAHPHIHIVTTNVQQTGKRIDLHNIGRNQSEQTRKKIESMFGLVQAEGRTQAYERIPAVTADKVIYGKSQTKRSISNVVRTITRSYKYTSLAELNAALQQFNVVADRGKEGSRMHEKKGLLYSVLDSAGGKVGVPIKASTIYGKPTLAFLEKQFALNDVLRKPFREELKRTVGNALQQAKRTSAFTTALAARNIDVVFRRNDKGRIYGITYVDHRNKVVFNGSDLGKAFSANAVLARLQESKPLASSPEDATAPQPPDKHIQEGGEHSAATEMQGRTAHELDRMLTDLFIAQQVDYTSPDAATRKRRKKKRRKRSI